MPQKWTFPGCPPPISTPAGWTASYYGVSTGSNAFAVLANPTLFKEAGVDLPDDSTWTWEEYAETRDVS